MNKICVMNTNQRTCAKAQLKSNSKVEMTIERNKWDSSDKGLGRKMDKR